MSENENGKIKTGLDIWAGKHGSSAEEILILLAAEKRDAGQFLGEALSSPAEIAPGRDSALGLLLERGRKGEISISSEVISKIVPGIEIAGDNISSGVLQGTLAANGITCSDGPDDSAGDVIETLVKTAEDVLESANGGPEKNPGTMSQPEKNSDKGTDKKPAPRKKTKYSVSKAMLDEFLKSRVGGDISTKFMRQFFLSLPDFKALDIAMMSDQEIQAEFTKNYVAAQLDSGTVVLAKHSYEQLRDILANSDSYFIGREVKPQEK